ncbi:MAG: DUF2520 domain-containing protein [Chitinophagaceae bacterium]
METVIIGSGNVATVLAEKLSANGVAITQIIARNPNTGKALAEKTKAQYTDDYNRIVLNADVYIICVQDDFLPETAQKLEKVLPKDRLVVHTTGSASIKILEKVSSRYGVLYPLQSLRKENSSVKEMPLFLDANIPETLSTLELLANKISFNIGFADDEQRIRLHIAAVFVSNFPNYLYTIAESFSRQHGIDFSFLLPLMEESVSRLHRFAPKEIQTGPAARGDLSTIQKHESILQKENPEILEVYRFLTRKILDR